MNSSFIFNVSPISRGWSKISMRINEKRIFIEASNVNSEPLVGLVDNEGDNNCKLSWGDEPSILEVEMKKDGENIIFHVKCDDKEIISRQTGCKDYSTKAYHPNVEYPLMPE